MHKYNVLNINLAKSLSKNPDTRACCWQAVNGNNQSQNLKITANFQA